MRRRPLPPSILACSTLFLLLLAASPAPAQEAPVAIVDARLEGYPGPVTVLVAGGKVRAVAPGRQAPSIPGATVIDAQGGRVVAGRIDAFASLGQPDPNGRALDAFDPYDRRAIERALAAGVTTALLNPRRTSGLCGVASLIKLKPGAPLKDLIVVEEAAVCSSLGLGAAGPAARAAHAVALRAQLEGARTYRDAWLDYDEALEKYVEALAKKEGGEGKGAAELAPRRRGKPKPQAKPGDKKKDEGPKKPNQPPIDRTKALLVRVLDRELPLRIEAHRVEDIANALALQEAFGFRLILEGATEGYRFAEVLARREVPVVLGPILRSSRTPSFFPEQYRADTPARLVAAGVTLAIGSDSWEAIPTLPANAAAAGSAGDAGTLTPAEVEAALTSAAAEVLGVADRIGRVAAGYEADIVVLEPTDPLVGPGAERPRVVLVDGVVVYRRES